ncbi:hypothetical protein HU200_061677 [Digitaria exilis]|uniref:F-box domain-containing protein n=1 Tax=Digitaria exilis TaxID=1010633 RepID=A0A835A8Q0_9POAL|nr:hypothetical protein HU200_061677 [Digitaria exilis]
MATVSPANGVRVLDEGWNLPPDALVEILLRLSPICRRLVRLVCRHWRDVIDERTPPIPPPKVLAFFTGQTSASAYVVDDLADGRGREVWGVSIVPGTKSYMDITMVGTCNGLLCLCDNTKPGGAVALFNPATREKLRVPAVPVSYREWYGNGRTTYTFGYDATAGKYKILHLPCHEDVSGGFNALQAFALGDDTSWRDVAVPGGSSCCPGAGVVSVRGAAYWVTNAVERVVCFDLKDERVTFDAPLPVVARRWYQFQLTEVHGRLGLAVCTDMRTSVTTTEEVWVLGDRQGWTVRYRVRVDGLEQQRLAAPYFAAHGGEYVLAVRTDERWRKQLHAHRLREGGIWLQRGEVRSVRINQPGTKVAYCSRGTCSYLRTFAYVETTEPLSPYKIHGRILRGSTSK